MVIEIRVPDDWTPGLTLAIRQLVQGTCDEGFPIVTLVKKDVTAAELTAISDRIKALVADAGLAA